MSDDPYYMEGGRSYTEVEYWKEQARCARKTSEELIEKLVETSNLERELQKTKLRFEILVKVVETIHHHARMSNDFAYADKLREILEIVGVRVEDKPLPEQEAKDGQKDVP